MKQTIETKSQTEYQKKKKNEEEEDFEEKKREQTGDDRTWASG